MILGTTARPWWPRRLTPLLVAGWTAFVALALWWLLGGHGGPSLWILHESGQPAVGEQVQRWFRIDTGFERVYPWVLLGPYVALVASFFPLERGRLRLSLPLNLAACVAFLTLSQALDARVRRTFSTITIVKSAPQQTKKEGGSLRLQVAETDQQSAIQMPTSPHLELSAKEALPSSLTNFLADLPSGFQPRPRLAGWPKEGLWPSLLDLLAYGAVVGLAHSIHFYRRFRERERRALTLESSLANARLHALRAQLQPHFLFNSLNAVVTLLRRDPRLAEATLLSLSELLRLALSQSERQQVPLREELEFLQRYFQIQQARFGDRLRLEEDIDPTALDCLVPTLLLQPLVENALRHGIEPSEDSGLVRLTAHRSDSTLVLIIEDDGVGLAASRSEETNIKPAALRGDTSPVTTPSSVTREVVREGTGIGLANVRARLEALYGPAGALELIPRTERGLSVRIELPWHTLTQPGASGAAVHP
ncbi:membrane hypothetical protein [Verrucomicrobia bacterium]|nr:membrane hypothetical protein [Verrucomicrobiota bacterium]